MADTEEKPRKITPKHERFCQEYLLDLNATKAAERAGYSEKTAKSQGCRLLTNADLKARIKELMIERGERVQLDQDYVLHNLTVIVERCMERAPVMTREGRELVQKMDDEGRHVWEFDSSGANTALGLLGKHLKLFTEKHEHSGPDGKPIEHRDMSGVPDEQITARIEELLAKRKPVAE